MIVNSSSNYPRLLDMDNYQSLQPKTIFQNTCGQKMYMKCVNYYHQLNIYFYLPCFCMYDVNSATRVPTFAQTFGVVVPT